MTFKKVEEDFGGTMRESLLKYFRDEETFGFMEQDERWEQLVGCKYG